MDLRDKLKYFEKDFISSKTIDAVDGKDIDHFVEGEEKSNAFGHYFLSSTGYPSDAKHGAIALNSIQKTDPRIFRSVTRDETFPTLDLSRTLFIDTETTGLAGGTGTVPFLVGIGYFVNESFQIDQYFMRDYHEETALLKAIEERLKECQILVSYNGKCYDLSILATRFTLSRMKNPVIDTPHLDLLFPVRRLWRRRIGDCSLTHVERTILGFERQNDVPGFLIPSLYFEYLRTRNGRSLEPVFLHNRWDIIALAALTGLTGQVHQTPLEQLDDPADLYSLGFVYESMSEVERAVLCFEEALKYTDSSQDLEGILMALGRSLKRLERWDEALAVWQKMIQQGTRRIFPYEEIAKYYEHRAKDFQLAAEIVHQALEKLQGIEKYHPESHYVIDRQDLEYRLARLVRKLGENKT